MKEHRFEAWTGNKGTGTSGYAAYSRDHVIRVPGKPELRASSAPAFRGDGSLHNPEDLLVASLSTCHMLWFLHVASDAGLIVTGYVDSASGTMVVESGGAGQFASVVLRPRVTVAGGSAGGPDVGAHVAELHHKAHEKCFIARSVNFPVTIEGSVGNATTS
ncbi:MAG: OsmC family protein [Deltaproteobacteria bacterium]|nr:OsmC family protein [Deltaproteobacteria bacterium]